jgi:hypothetical protein
MRNFQRKVFAMGVVIALSLGTTTAQGANPYPNIANDTTWLDNSGNEIKAQGGSVLQVGSTYYWIGTQMDNGSFYFVAVNLYKSTNLQDWTFVKAIFTPSGTGDLGVNKWVGRPDLIYNPTTAKYIVVVEAQGGGGPGNTIGFASSSTVEGTYTYAGSTTINGGTVGDHSIYVEGNNAYMTYDGDSAHKRNVTLNIAPLASDWMSVGAPILSQANSGREAPNILKVGSTYHWFASGQDWWNSTATQHAVGTSLSSFGAWSTVNTVPASTDSFSTQADFIIPITGTGGTSYIYAGDRYSNMQASGHPAPTGYGRNAWYELTFSGTTPTIRGYTDMAVNLTTGALTGNYVANGRFDMYVAGSTVPLWSESGTASAAFTELGGVTNNKLTQKSTNAYQAYTYQNISLPNGTYTFTAKVKSSGGQTSAALLLKSYGGADITIPVTASASWVLETQVFTVTTGTVQVAVSSNSPANDWLSADEIAIWKN